MIILLSIQYFGQRPLSRKNMIKAFGRNIELRVKLSYVFNIIQLLTNEALDMM